MCQTCQSLQQALDRAIAEDNTEKARIMGLLLDNHKAQHRPAPVVVWKDEKQWVMSY